MINKIFDAKDTILENGLRVITIKKDTKITSVHCGVKCGPLYEKESEKGISHFIEHMLFKGTSKRNNEQLNDELEQLGGEYNAYTDYTCTVYGITALEDELENIIELLSDMIINSTFPLEEVEKERGVILAEVRTSRDDIEDYSFKRTNQVAFKESALKYEVIGEEKIIQKFTHTQLEQYYKKYYIPNNSFLTIVSSFEHEDIMKIIKQYFMNWEKGILQKKNIIIENNIPLVEVSVKKEIEQSTITYLYTFHHLKKEDELALKILSHKLGESANSILFRELREERGLAYDIYTHLDLTSYIKTMYIYTAVSEENIDEAIEVISLCIQELKDEAIIIDDKVVNLMKKVLKTAVASTLEDSSDLGNYVLHQCIDGEDIYEFFQDMKDMENIKGEDIYRVSRLVLNNPTIHILKSKR